MNYVHALFLSAALVAQSTAAADRVTVLTSYPQELVSQFEEAFAAAHPELRLEVVWRAPRDALPFLLAPGHGGVDVYWAASPRTFAALAEADALLPPGIDRAELPGRIGGTVIDDRDGRYLATEVAAGGFALNLPALQAAGVPVPVDWEDLAAPVHAGRIAMPIPSQVGFASTLYDVRLQARGWERGWALLSEIAGNARRIGSRGAFVTDEVGAGRLPIGLTLDFFANSAIANGAPIAFRYPRTTGYTAAHVAVLAGTSNRASAGAFVGFVLSPDGQRLLAHPDLRRLPVRPEVYATLPDGYYNPFAAAESAGMAYDAGVALARSALVQAYFDVVVTERHAALVAMWKAIHALESAGAVDSGKQAVAARARIVATRWPLHATEASAPALAAQFSAAAAGDAAAVRAVAGLRATWADALDAQYAEATAIARAATRVAAAR